MKEYFVQFWGGAEKQIEQDLGIKKQPYYFKTEKDRQRFINKIKRYSKFGLAIDCKEGEMTHKRTVADVTLLHNGKTYKFDYDFGYEYPRDSALFQFEENNYSCDCNRSLFINEYCDENFEEMDCGENIKLVNIDIKYID